MQAALEATHAFGPTRNCIVWPNATWRVSAKAISCKPTALVNEAFLRLIDWQNVEWRNRAHFFGLAAQIMRRILVDFARARHREKRGGGEIQVSLSEAANVPSERSADLVALDDALADAREIGSAPGPRGGTAILRRAELEETAEALNVSVGTVRRDWSLAEAWFFRELNRKGSRHDA